MKRILIAGDSSYIGRTLIRWMNDNSDEYLVETINLRDPLWKKKDYSLYDSVIHLVGIAHVNEKKVSEELYDAVNYRLTVENAAKSLSDGVKQFVVLSSMSVYGISSGIITKDTEPNPTSKYGKSKLKADRELLELSAKGLKVAIIRPPMVYGKGCRGNYQLLSKAARRLCIFPNIVNERSMIYIDNLCEFICNVIRNESQGIFHPQNGEYVCTADMVNKIAAVHHHNIKLVSVFNSFIEMSNNNLLKKVFGNLVYEKDDICSTVSFEESIFMTEHSNE